ncbi:MULTISPECIES: hypothetical protein [unclassified Dinoroseobacter]
MLAEIKTIITRAPVSLAQDATGALAITVVFATLLHVPVLF